MKIELYKSALCPRCAYAAHVLKELQGEFDGIELVTYDLFTDLNAFKEANVKMIPAIRIDNKMDSWVFPKASEIRAMVLEKQ